MQSWMRALSFLAAAALATGAARADDTLRLASGPQRTALLELYTSEGCSSCPRADRWLSGLVDDQRLWREVVPVAFHVDYWDYIGWEDRFARPQFSARQRDYARQGHVRSVYTPGFVLGGEEWRGWFRRPVLSIPPAADPGRLEVEARGDALSVRFEPTAAARGAREVHVAVLGFGLSTRVQAGENHGRTLEHDFVVLGYATSTLSADGETGRAYVATATLPSALAASAPRKALAVWVSEPGDRRPVQAVGGWM